MPALGALMLKCDCCGNTHGAGETHGQFDGHLLRAEASRLQWQHVKPDADYCPKCAPVKQEQHA